MTKLARKVVRTLDILAWVFIVGVLMTVSVILVVGWMHAGW